MNNTGTLAPPNASPLTPSSYTPREKGISDDWTNTVRNLALEQQIRPKEWCNLYLPGAIPISATPAESESDGEYYLKQCMEKIAMALRDSQEVNPISFTHLCEFVAEHQPTLRPDINISREGNFTLSWELNKTFAHLEFEENGTVQGYVRNDTDSHEKLFENFADAVALVNTKLEVF